MRELGDDLSAGVFEGLIRGPVVPLHRPHDLSGRESQLRGSALRVTDKCFGRGLQGDNLVPEAAKVLRCLSLGLRDSSLPSGLALVRYAFLDVPAHQGVRLLCLTDLLLHGLIFCSLA